MLKLLVESPFERKLYRVKGEEILIGRSRAADIPVVDDGAKKRHVVVKKVAGAWRFTDLSEGGTRKNGELAAEGSLRVGDSLELSVTRITLKSILSSPTATNGEPEEESAAEDPALQSVLLAPETPDAFLAKGLRSVLDINKRLAREKAEPELLALILDAAIDLSGAERGFLLTISKGELATTVGRNFEGRALEDPDMEFSRSIALSAVEKEKPVLSSDAGRDERWTGMESVAALSLRSVLAVPLLSEAGPVGALYVDNRIEKRVFEEHHVRLLAALADQAALAIVAARRERERKERTKELAKKNREVERLASRLEAELSRTREDLRHRQSELEFRYDYEKIIGRAPAMRQVLAVLDKVTELNVPVFIEGESGTGKELVARALHFNGPRREGPFVTENCSAIPETLIEKVLFGHVKGAFTGADRDAPGLFEQADGGTLFLDEVGDMSGEMQKKILRVLQEKEVRRLGGKTVHPVDVRIVSATNRDVEGMKDVGDFREDLFWRLVVVRLRIPPLRERSEDVPVLLDHFLGVYAEEMETEKKKVEAGALDLLTRYPWPGNVRELMNEIRRVVALSGRRIDESVLSERIRLSPPAPRADWATGRPMKEVVEEVERRMIESELARNEGNKTRTAEALGLSRLGLRNKIERYGIDG